eukprot:Pompholyxophrys_sp_v1_NODE_77_length_2346_cov_4.460733.p2 type:complete len:140 gc:universal NODE_77_length_2346_cov_4.460733:772-1191(+)
MSRFAKFALTSRMSDMPSTKTKYLRKDLNEVSDTKVVIFHDFTQVQVQNTFFQDLILVIYLAGGRLKYFHYVGETSNTKNNINFVTAAWHNLLTTKNVFDGMRRVVIWSDGGPKHFRISACMQFFNFLKKNVLLDFQYN